MAYNIKRGRGRPQSETKMRSFNYVTPRGFKFSKVDRKNGQFVFKKLKE
jgi:hypothetical protein